MTLAAPRAWVLNLDAEHELAQGRSYVRSPARYQQIERASALLGALLSPNDVIVPPDPVGAPNSAKGLPGCAWCPTPRALAMLKRAGARLPAAPAASLLRRVNDRAFAIQLDPGPLGTRYFTELSPLLEALAGPWRGPWLLKRGLSFAGRGHRRLFEALSEADRSWCAKSLRGGQGLALEPYVDRLMDFALHGHVDQAGGLRFGRPTLMDCDAKGAWRGSSSADGAAGAHADTSLHPHERSALEDAAYKAGTALHHAGYFGPFGVDAFRYRSSNSATAAFNPMVEINARFSMGWGQSGCALPPFES